LPALLFTTVSSRAPCSISASISSDGMPALPKPPISTVAPIRDVGHRKRGVGQVLSITPVPQFG